MWTCSHVWMGAVAACLAAMCLGCQPGGTEKPQKWAAQGGAGAGNQGTPKGGATGEKSSGKAVASVQEPPPPPTIPNVRLSEALLATCLVRVGDTMPDADLPDFAGNVVALRSLSGQKLTVVCFWAGGNSKHNEQSAIVLLEDLEKEIFEPCAAKGVQVIGVNEKEMAQTAGPLVSQAGAKFPNLLDAQGALLSKVATEKIPRIYLLDTAGKILWFDVEYSRSTRRELLQAVRVALGEI